MTDTLKELAQEIVDELYSHMFLSEKTDFKKATEQVYQTLLKYNNKRHSYGC